MCSHHDCLELVQSITVEAIDSASQSGHCALLIVWPGMLGLIFSRLVLICWQKVQTKTEPLSVSVGFGPFLHHLLSVFRTLTFEPVRLVLLAVVIVQVEQSDLLETIGKTAEQAPAVR